MKSEQEFSRAYISNFYKKQLIKFEKIGIGNETENGVIVTQKLIDITNKRLQEIQPLTARMVAEYYKRLELLNFEEKK
tara:strand:+ start:235 stop:468 length:234 start_codon:yes stop_codon:yes gene_type:complete